MPFSAHLVIAAWAIAESCDCVRAITFCGSLFSPLAAHKILSDFTFEVRTCGVSATERSLVVAGATIGPNGAADSTGCVQAAPPVKPAPVTVTVVAVGLSAVILLSASVD